MNTPPNGPGWYQVGDKVQWWDGQNWYITPGPTGVQYSCYACAASLSPAARFCSNCGQSAITPLSTAPLSPSPSTSAEDFTDSQLPVASASTPHDPITLNPAPGVVGPTGLPIPAHIPNYATPVFYTAEEASPTYSGWWRRATAFFLSNLFGSALNLLTLILIYLFISTDDLSAQEIEDLASMISGFAILVVFLTWILVAQSRTGAWIDMRALGIKLVDQNTLQPLSYGRAFIRNIASVLNLFTLGIGYLMPLWTKRKQTLADIICSTVVIRSR